MDLVHSDEVFDLNGNTSLEYKRCNPLLKLLGQIETIKLAAEREYYVADSLQYLFPLSFLQLYPPSDPKKPNDPRLQDDKLDFQKQNLHEFHLDDTTVVRGLVRIDHNLFPFLKVSYKGGPDSKLGRLLGESPGQYVTLSITIGSNGPTLIRVPYSHETNLYNIELWGADLPITALKEALDSKGRQSLDAGCLVNRPDLLVGNMENFGRDSLAEKDVASVDPQNVYHPILPLRLRVCWRACNKAVQDPADKAEYTYAFSMLRRGWENYLSVGVSEMTHGQPGGLQYRNLFSNYVGKCRDMLELGRTLEPWNIDAFGNKPPRDKVEPFFCVNFMDLLLLNKDTGIGLHRHRDNQEAYSIAQGRGIMVVGDWCKMPERDRCFEVRTVKSGDVVLIRGGNLHGLMNATDERLVMHVFGSYD